MENDENLLRIVLKTEEFNTYFHRQNQKVQDKYDYAIQIIETQYVVSKKFVKKILGTDLYEVRISAGNNEHRTMLVAIDHTNFIEAKKVVLLNSFVKKSTKQYSKEIEKAMSLLNNLRF